MSENLEDYISTAEAAQLTGYARQYIANLLQAGKVAGRKFGGRWLVNRQSILQYQAQQGQKESE